MEFLNELKATIASVNPDTVPKWIYRYYRKLAVAVCKESIITNFNVHEKFDEDTIITPRQSDFKPFVAPYTLRTLKPFILIDRETEPPRVKLMKEICEKKNREYIKQAIVYKYVQQRHIKAINRLCSTHFWPDINVSDALQCPEFSVVVEYGRIVIGFGFLVPDVSHTDAYISFIFVLPGWRRAGIAKYMLYHLINTCRGKDITLHVSASNSQALLLYQHFAFKPEEFIRDFYDKFIPANSRECRHAFFLRLSK